MEAKEANIGQWILFQNEPYQIKRKENVAFGTHSHSKTKLFLKPLSKGGVKEAIFSHTDRLEEVEIVKKTGNVIAKLQNKVQIMDTVSYETFDADVDKELLNTIKEGDEVIFINYNGVKVLEKK